MRTHLVNHIYGPSQPHHLRIAMRIKSLEIRLSVSDNQEFVHAAMFDLKLGNTDPPDMYYNPECEYNVNVVDFGYATIALH